MFAETLSKDTARALEILGKSDLLQNAYLAGGTACALQIGHRISIDLDFFTLQEFDAKQTIKALQKLGGFMLDKESWGTILGSFEEVRFSLFVYEYPILFPLHRYSDVQLIDLRDIAAMKIAAISDRGLMRDFIDLYFILQRGYLLEQALEWYGSKFKTLASNRMHILKSLVYFEDAEASEPPKMLVDFEWGKLKRFLEHEVKKLAP